VHDIRYYLNGMLFVADTKNGKILSISVGSGADVDRNAVCTVLRGLEKPRAIALVGSFVNYDPNNPPALYVVDSGSYRILKVVLQEDGLVKPPVFNAQGAEIPNPQPIAGMNQIPGWVGNPAPVQQNFYSPSGIVLFSDQKTIFIAYTVNSVIRRLTLDDAGIWNATTVAGMVGAKGSINGIGTDALTTDGESRHIVWRIYSKKQNKSKEVDTDQD
jgi:hypothetical protein